MPLVEEESDDEDDENKSTSIWTIAKMNSSEWWQILLGCFASIVSGTSMPIFAVIFGEILGVNAINNQ